MNKKIEITRSLLTIATLYAPFIWYMGLLSANYAGATDFFELRMTEIITIVVLTFLPLQAFRWLKIKWRSEVPLL